MEKANRLSQETSPYLLQHAHNPVDWFPWGDEALQKARTENKPILVSIGYSACHWCHVMERESFEDESTAEIMNQNFVNIKIDREERPDLDHIYMDAVQAMTGSGGWPLNVFLTPDCKPFYGGTYFPPRDAYNLPSWKNILAAISKSYQEKREEIESQANNVLAHLVQSNSFGESESTNDAPAFSAKSLDVIFENIMKSADRVEGGFGRAPKFPQTFIIHYLLNYFHYTKDEAALKQACLSLDKMIHGGIYDQVGGGFSRYSTDASWLVPHFEKMLYDNALLLMVLSEAWQLTHKELYQTTIRQTLEFVQRELLSPEGGFYAALDADSEGVEGKFYVWDHSEIVDLLGTEAELFCEFYDVTEEGNWESENILHVNEPLEEFARRKNIPEQELTHRLKVSANKLLKQRNTRIRPNLDDKILLGWNSLMNTALSKSYAAIGDESYKALALRNMEFLLSRFQNADGSFNHTFKNEKARYPAFLDDYACLVQALFHLQEISGNATYLEKARGLIDYVTGNFSTEDGVMFYYTGRDQTDVVIRKQEKFDGALPSGNSIMAWNLLYAATIFEQTQWQQRVVKMLNSVAGTTEKYPTSFGIWADVMQMLVKGVYELVLTGTNNGILLKEILHTFIPHKVLQVSAYENNNFPLLRGKDFTGGPLIYLCKNYACQAPVNNIKSFTNLLEKSTEYSDQIVQ